MRSLIISIALPWLVRPKFACAEDGIDYLNRVAATYSRLTSFQVEAFAETSTTIGNRAIPVAVRVALYFSPPHQTRVDVKGADNSLQTVMIWNGKELREFHSWDATLRRIPSSGFDIKFNPERGEGMGEMLYSTIDSGVTAALIRGRETLQVGNDRFPCVILDVAYGDESHRKYSFWVSEDRAIVLKRSVTFVNAEGRKTVTSSIVALTLNEDIPMSTFQLNPPVDTRLVAD
jgi:outer membrane lipoprotein-sorting protein